MHPEDFGDFGTQQVGRVPPSCRHSTVKKPWGEEIMLAPRRSPRRVRAPGLQGQGAFMAGGERNIMAATSGRERPETISRSAAMSRSLGRGNAGPAHSKNDGQLSGGRFPLTPALSLGERGKIPPPHTKTTIPVAGWFQVQGPGN